MVWHAYHNVMFFLGVSNMPPGAPCDCIIAILDNSDAAEPFIITTFPALLIVITANNCHHDSNVSDSNKTSMQLLHVLFMSSDN